MKTKKKKRTEYNVSQDDFVRIWNSSPTVKSVSEKTGMPKPIAMARASNYRGRGVTMKPMPKINPRSIDPVRLNEVAREALARPGV